MANEPVIHVIDDDEAVRDSLDFMLDAAGLAVRTWDSALPFLAAIDGLDQACIVTDIRMPDMTGLELVQKLKARGVRTPVIVITGHADVPLAVEAMKAGVVDFIEKPFENQRLIGAIRAALAQAPAEADDATREIAARLDSLSGREREVLDGLVAGHANKVIAFDLGISPRTVEVYRANVMAKMQARSLSELVRMAIAAPGR
ncbi:MAG TPA: response regulator FixJ [Allosphingosinicella sp.]|nr:response regulator FixJ [Allosphingosinicella sp.]